MVELAAEPEPAATVEWFAKPERAAVVEPAPESEPAATAEWAAQVERAAKPEWLAMPEPAAEAVPAAKTEQEPKAAQAATVERATEPEQAMREATPDSGAPDSGHRGSRARLIRRPLVTAVIMAGLLTVVGGTVGLTQLTGRPADIPRPLAKSSPPPVGLIAAPPPPHSSKRVPLPVELSIPRIGVRTRLLQLGRTPQGTLQVPVTTTEAGWYTGSPRPGEIGSSVIAGHIDSRLGPGVFFRLRLLRPGNLVYVRRANRTLVVFRVTAERMYPKGDFPTQQVYGPVPDAELHLITCGGPFDPVTGSYLSNVVVYATQISVRQPRHHHGRRHRHQPLARHS